MSIWRPLVSLLLLCATACATQTPIRQILNDPRTYDGKTVTLEGEVTNTFSLMIIKYFEINDGTGAIGVVSSKALPAKGQRIKVTGEIRQAFSLGDRNLTVLMEDGPKPSKQISEILPSK
jgi:hypothetical protein